MSYPSVSELRHLSEGPLWEALPKVAAEPPGVGEKVWVWSGTLPGDPSPWTQSRGCLAEITPGLRDSEVGECMNFVEFLFCPIHGVMWAGAGVVVVAKWVWWSVFGRGKGRETRITS